MMLRRLNPRPTSPWCQKPSSSGPRWESRSVRYFRSGSITGRPEPKFQIPAIPHIRRSSATRARETPHAEPRGGAAMAERFYLLGRKDVEPEDAEQERETENQ